MGIQGKSLCVLTPMYGGNLSLNYHNSIMKLKDECSLRNIGLGFSDIWNESLISRARNRLVDSYLKEHSETFALIVDADIGFEPQDIFQMMEFDKDILGVPCTKKSIRWDRIQNAIARRVLAWAHGNPVCQNGKTPQDLAELFLQSPQAFNPADLPKIGGDFVLNLLPVEGTTKELSLIDPEIMKHAGTGLLLVKREVFKKFMRAYPDRWYEAKSDPASNPGKVHDFFKTGINLETREYDSEDYWFCHDCIQIGYKVHMLLNVKTTHMGTGMFFADAHAALATSGTIF